MDLIENTLHVVENRTRAQDNLCLLVEGFREYQNDIDETKQKLQETQLLCSNSKEILELNNFIKNAFNENTRLYKQLFDKVYSHAQQIGEKLSTIIDQEGSLENSYQEVVNCSTVLESKYNKKLTLLHTLGQDCYNQLTKNICQIQQHINETDEDIKGADENWKILIDEFEEKNKIFETLTLDISILNDNLEAQKCEQDAFIKSIQQKTSERQMACEQATNQIDAIKDKILKTEEEIITIYKSYNEQLKLKEELARNHVELKGILDCLTADCVNTEMLIKTTEEESAQTLKSLAHEIELQKKLILEKEKELADYKTKGDKIIKEVDEMSLKIESVNEELFKMKSESEKREELKQDIVNAIAEASKENGIMEEEIKNVKDDMEQSRNDMMTKQLMLEELQCGHEYEKSEIQKQSAVIEQQQVEKGTLEKEIETVDGQNQNLEQNIENYQLKIQDLLSISSNLEKENTERNATLRNLDIQIGNLTTELKRLEATKEQNKSFTPAPPLKRLRSAKPTARKRGIVDLDSDSSIEGEKMTLTQFLEKKKMLRK